MGYLFTLLLLLVIAFLLFRFVSACKKANQTDWGSPLLNVLEGMNRLFCHRYHRLNEVTIPLNESGPAIVVSNHISGLDPMLMIATSPRPWLFKAVGCIPIDRSKQADNAMRQAIKALDEGEVLAIFPHGKIHLPEDGQIKMKPGAARLAVKLKCPIYPLLISGVRSPGNVLTPVLLRAEARINVCDPIGVAFKDITEINRVMASCIEAN